MKKATIITRSYPPNKGINGLLANEMAGCFLGKGVAVDIICITGESVGNKKEEIPNGNIHSIKPLNNKSNKIKKTLSLLFEGLKLIRKAKSLNSDLIIITTSPPLLPLWASLLLKKRKWALWSFDLFPEGLAIGGLMNPKGWLYKLLLKLTYKNAPSYLIALGEEQAQFIQQQYKKKIKTFILPAGVLLHQEKSESINTPTWMDTSKITLGYFGNLGIAHNSKYIKSIIDFVDTHSDFRFVISTYGIHADEVKGYAKLKSNIVVIDGGIPEEDLKYIDIHVVSLKSSWTHIAVPSKAVTAISSGRPILFCGDEKSDNWQMFKTCGWLVQENRDISLQLDEIFGQLSVLNIEEKASHADEIYADLKEQVLKTYDKIVEICKL